METTNEESLAAQLSSAVESRLRGFELRTLEIEVAHGSGIDEKSLSDSLIELFSKKGFNRTRIKISEKDARLACSSCKSEFSHWHPDCSKPVASCPKCGSDKIAPVQGNSVEIKRIEVWPGRR